MVRTVKDKALSAHDKLVRTAQKRSADQQGAFFTALFHLAAEAFEDDVKHLCERAEQAFKEIEAHEHVPQMNKDWLKGVTGEKDNFYSVSTGKLMSDLVTTPRRKRRKKRLSDDEIKRIKNDIEAAIIDDDSPRDLHQALTSSRAYVTKSSPMMRV